MISDSDGLLHVCVSESVYWMDYVFYTVRLHYYTLDFRNTNRIHSEIVCYLQMIELFFRPSEFHTINMECVKKMIVCFIQCRRSCNVEKN